MNIGKHVENVGRECLVSVFFAAIFEKWLWGFCYLQINDVFQYTNNFKYTKLDIVNRNTNRKVELHPAGSLDLGLEVGYKWFFDHRTPPMGARTKKHPKISQKQPKKN